MTTTPGHYDLTIYQGATLSQAFTWKDENGTPINLTGYSARMQARADAEAVDPFINLNTQNATITLGGASGTITLLMSAAETAALTILGGPYDLEMIDGSGRVTRLLEGTITVSKEITR